MLEFMRLQFYFINRVKWGASLGTASSNFFFFVPTGERLYPYVEEPAGAFQVELPIPLPWEPQVLIQT